MREDHRYQANLSWSGSTATGYRGYDRTHRVQTPPAATTLTLSADPTFRGTPELTNPEQLLLAAAASCQLLSLLSLAARAGVDVVGYTDEAQAVMRHDLSAPMRIDRILLRPRITVRVGDSGPPDQATLLALVEQAHRECFIANTLNAQFEIEPEWTFEAALGSS